MVFKRLLVLISILLIVAMLGACVRSASTPPARVLQPAEGEPSQEPVAEDGAEKAPEGQPTNEVLQQLALFVTQTAAAAQIASGQQPADAGQAATPYPGAETGQAVSPYPSPEAGQAVSPYPSPEAGQAVSPYPSPEAGQEGAAAGGSPSEQTQTGQAAEATQGTSAGQSGAEQAGSQSPAATQPSDTGQPAASSGNVVVITPTPGIPKSYTLQSGEFPYCIARRFNVNPFELLSINGLTTSSIVQGGTTLRIPQTGNPFPGERSLKAHPTNYVVQGGENIYEIACAFGSVSPDMIALANGLKSPFTLTSGMTLNIP